MKNSGACFKYEFSVDTESCRVEVIEKEHALFQ